MDANLVPALSPEQSWCAQEVPLKVVRSIAVHCCVVTTKAWNLGNVNH